MWCAWKKRDQDVVPAHVKELAVDVSWTSTGVKGYMDMDVGVALWDASDMLMNIGEKSVHESADGEVHTVNLDFNTIPSSTQHMFITAKIREPGTATFEDVQGLGCRLFDNTTAKKKRITELALPKQAEDQNGLIIARLIKKGTSWTIEKTNQFTSDLENEMLQILGFPIKPAVPAKAPAIVDRVIPEHVKQLVVGLGWDPIDRLTGEPMKVDCDLSVVLFDASGHDPVAAVYYQNKKADGLEHMGDCQDGTLEGDAEIINIDLARIPCSTENIFVCINIRRPVNATFKNMKNLECSLYDQTDGTDGQKKLIQVFKVSDSSEDVEAETGLVLVRLVKDGSTWTIENTSRFCPGRYCGTLLDEMRQICGRGHATTDEDPGDNVVPPRFNYGEDSIVPVSFVQPEENVVPDLPQKRRFPVLHDQHVVSEHVEQLAVGVKWDDFDPTMGAKLNLDVDVSVVLFDDASADAILAVNYSMPKAPGLQHMGDCREGAIEGIDETIAINLTEIPTSTQYIFIVLNVYNPSWASFLDVRGLECKLYDQTHGETKQITEFSFGPPHATNGLILARLIKTGASWTIENINQFGRGRDYIDLLDDMLALRDSGCPSPVVHADDADDADAKRRRVAP